MQTIWKGSVAFGLVNVPIKLYAATEDHDVRFHQVHATDGGRVKMLRSCSIDGQPVEYKDIAKAYESDSGEVVVMRQEDFDGLPVPGGREIEVLEFVPSDQVDPLLFDRSYYLEPEPRALKPYVLLREALARTDRMALVRVVLRHKTQLAALRVRGDVLVLQTMLWPDEVRVADFDVLETPVDIRPQELSMAASLVDSLSSDFDPEAFHDDYREALLAVIDRRLAGGEGVGPAAADAAGGSGDGVVLDLMSALRESVERRRPDRAGASETDTDAVAVSPKKRAPARPRKPRARAASDGATGAARAPAKGKAKAATRAATKKAAPTPEPKSSRRRSA